MSNVALFAIIFSIAVIFFAWSCYSRFRLVLIGKADNRFNEIGKRIWNMLFFAFGQRKVVTRSYPFGLNHFIFFWCFLTLLIANTEFLLHGLFPEYISLSLLPLGLHYALAFIFDIVSLFALLAALVAIGRRLFFPPKYIDARTRDSFAVLGLVAILMIAFFGMHGSEIAHGLERAAPFMPVSNLVASMLLGLKLPLITLAYLVFGFWWVHALALLSFLDYLPYSKHIHILTSIPNCFFKNLEKVNTQPREEFKKDSVFGAGQVDRFRWKDLFDSYSCTECGRCSHNCPATNTDKPLNPRLVVHHIKVNLLHNGPLLEKKKKPTMPLIGSNDGQGTVSEGAIWSCTTCGACMEVCPVSIEHVPKIISLRRHLVEMEAKFPEELLSFFNNMETRSNPWGIAPSERTNWAADRNVKPFEKGKTEYLFYVGCAGSLNSRSKRNTMAVARILDAAGISWGILGKDEMCCGDSLRRLGNEFVFDRMARENIKQFQDSGIKKIITQCPHCYNTLKNDYRQYGANIEVFHHTTFINQLIKEDKLIVGKNLRLGKVVFHDSCYLGRYNAIYREPREIIETVTGQAPAEMGRHHDKSFCCGAGGGRMWIEENLGTRINLERVGEALKENPDTICVCCPYCMLMFEDGLRDKNASDKVKILELSEIVAGALKSDT